jgi:hypothetical protein
VSNFWQYILIPLAVYYGIWVPYELYKSLGWRKSVALKELDYDALPLNVAAHFEAQATVLDALGFEPETLQVWSYKATDEFIFEQRFVQADEKVTASVRAFQGADRVQPPFCLLSFYAEWESGRSVEVVNSDYYALWASEPGDISFILEDEGNIAYLHALHLFALQRQESQFPDSTRVRYTASAEQRLEAMQNIYDWQVKSGILRYDTTTETYRVTVRGAYRMMLFTYWPFSELVKAEIRLRAENLKLGFYKSKAIK